MTERGRKAEEGLFHSPGQDSLLRCFAGVQPELGRGIQAFAEVNVGEEAGPAGEEIRVLCDETRAVLPREESFQEDPPGQS